VDKLEAKFPELDLTWMRCIKLTACLMEKHSDYFKKHPEIDRMPAINKLLDSKLRIIPEPLTPELSKDPFYKVMVKIDTFYQGEIKHCEKIINDFQTLLKRISSKTIEIKMVQDEFFEEAYFAPYFEKIQTNMIQKLPKKTLPLNDAINYLIKKYSNLYKSYPLDTEICLLQQFYQSLGFHYPPPKDPIHDQVIEGFKKDHFCMLKGLFIELSVSLTELYRFLCELIKTFYFTVFLKLETQETPHDYHS
jgi:hypothetical protein